MAGQRILFCAVSLLLICTIPAEAGNAPGKDLSQGGTVLLLGDSILDCHADDKRIEVVLRRLLGEKTPGAQWTVFNEAHGGEYIGPKEGTPIGVSTPLFTTQSTGRYFEIVHRHPKVDAVIVNYAANDSKVYPPDAFRERLEMLGGLLEKTYPGAILIFSTSMYLDPAHSAPYHIENPQAPGFQDGSSRNDYLEPYNQEIREFTARRGYRLADTFRRLVGETQRGNWDLRLRADEGNPQEDPQHQGDMRWFDNTHPNDKGTEVIARVLTEALLAPQAVARPLIFPAPREIEARGGSFALEPSVPVLLPEQASHEDLLLARFLVAELSDKHGLALEMHRTSMLPAGGRFILMGSVKNPLVRKYLERHGAQPAVRETEGYLLEVDANSVVIAGADDAGAFYGLQSLRQLLQGERAHPYVQGTSVRDWPSKPFRGIKLYLPGHEHIAYFWRFVRDFMALYKYNQMIVEVDAAMRLDRHPELNAGWLELGRNLNATRRDRSFGPGRQFQDSANADAADGEVLEKEEVAALVAYARQYHIEVIPEIPSLTHSYYLLTRHRELAEIADAEWPDTYCPSNPKVYDLLFDVLDEYIQVMKPRVVHVGHDEWRMPWGICPLCRGKDPRELYAQDITKIHDYLTRRGIKMAIYGDHLIEPLRGKGLKEIDNPEGQPYKTPGALSPEQVVKLIPKDILVFNWFWDDSAEGEGEADDIALAEWGFQQVYGNMEPNIPNYTRRAERRGVMGGAPSSWAATNEFNFGKDLMFDFLGCAQLLWSGQALPLNELSETIQSLLPGVRRNLSGHPFPSDYDPVVPVNIDESLSAPSLPGLGLDGLKAGQIVAGRMLFKIGDREGKRALTVTTGGSASTAIPIGEDASSIIFLHAAAKAARNIPAYEGTWDYADTADLLGWYEVTYEDGFVATVPLRYGVNILEAGWRKSHVPSHLAYEAELIDCGEPGPERLTFSAYEWINPRPGIRVKEVRLKDSVGFRGAFGKAAPDNTVLLAGVSVVKKRNPPEPKPLRAHDP
jgi:lysophospholipase L1-like esterase